MSCGFRVSRFWDFTILGFQVLGFYGFRVEMSLFQGFGVLGF